MDGLVKIEVSKNGAKSLRAVSTEMGKSINQIKSANHNLLSVVNPLKEDLGPKSEKILKIVGTIHDETEESQLSLMQLMRKLSDLASKIDDFCDGAGN